MTYEEWVQDWASRACFLMCDPSNEFYQGLMSKMVQEWDNHPVHAEGIKQMAEKWTKGEI